LVHFTGSYEDSESEHGVSVRYGYFTPYETLVGKTTSGNFPYPEGTANVYEVEVYRSFFDPIPGNGESTDVKRGTVVAYNWVNTPTAVPRGTKVITNKSNDAWWFQWNPSSPTEAGSHTVEYIYTYVYTYT